MARHTAFPWFRAPTLAGLLTLAIVVFAGSAQAHEWASHDQATDQAAAGTIASGLCPVAADTCGSEPVGGSSIPYSEVSTSHCAQAGVSAMPAAFATPVALSADINPMADQRYTGVFAPVDTPPPRA